MVDARDWWGFTLLELIVVMCVLTALAGLAAVGISYAFGASKETNTKNLLTTITGKLNEYKTLEGDFPLTTIDGMKLNPPNEFNNGIESLVAHFCRRKAGSGYWWPQDEDRFCNQDGDKLSGQIPKDWPFGDHQLRELQDYWGMPLFYIHHSNYDKPQPRHVRVKSTLFGSPSEVKPYKSGKSMTWANPGWYQLVSAGPDSKFGTEDDIKSW